MVKWGMSRTHEKIAPDLKIIVLQDTDGVDADTRERRYLGTPIPGSAELQLGRKRG